MEIERVVRFVAVFVAFLCAFAEADRKSAESFVKNGVPREFQEFDKDMAQSTLVIHDFSQAGSPPRAESSEKTNAALPLPPKRTEQQSPPGEHPPSPRAPPPPPPPKLPAPAPTNEAR